MSRRVGNSTEQPADLPDAFKVNGKGLPEKVFLLRFRWFRHGEAKREPGFRFYALYDRVYRPDVLRAAWDLVAANDGAPGVDGVSIQQVQSSEREMTGPKRCFVPIPALICQVNEHLRGWGNYFGAGYPRRAFRQINRFVQERLERHLKRRSQRPYRPRAGVTWYAQLRKLGLQPL